jgi:hypothetical protein
MAAASVATLIAFITMPAMGQSSDPLHLECTGPFGPASSAAQLADLFGSDNVVSETIDGPEGTTLDATLVFPNDPTRRLVVLWQDEAQRAVPAAIIVRDESSWIGPGGVRLGSTIEEVEAANGDSFNVLGFGWDYGGAASFPSGTLSQIPGGCVMSLSFDLDWSKEFGPEFNRIMGDQQLTSDDDLLRAASPTVSEIAVGYPTE